MNNKNIMNYFLLNKNLIKNLIINYNVYKTTKSPSILSE